MEKWDKSIVLGAQKGPYITEYSRSIVSWLGKDVLFLGTQPLDNVDRRLGIDNRTERTRNKINYDETYKKIFDRVNRELIKGQSKHLIVMLGRRCATQ